MQPQFLEIANAHFKKLQKFIICRRLMVVICKYNCMQATHCSILFVIITTKDEVKVAVSSHGLTSKSLITVTVSPIYTMWPLNWLTRCSVLVHDEDETIHLCNLLNDKSTEL